MDRKNNKEIKVILFTLPIQSNKEYRSIVNENVDDIEKCCLIDVFNSLFKMKKYTNYDMYLILSIFHKFLGYCNVSALKPLVDSIISLKFTSLEKDTDLAVLKYFEIINDIQSIMEEYQKTEAFSRYVFILNNNILQKYSLYILYEHLKTFLTNNFYFLIYYIKLGMFKEFCLKEEFIMDFYHRFDDGDLVDAAFSSELSLKLYIIENTRNKYLIQVYYNKLPNWYVRSLSQHPIPFFYYNFDIYGVFNELSKYHFDSLRFEEILDNLKSDLAYSSKLESDSACHGCSNIENQDYKIIRENAKQLITTFNKSLDPTELFNTFGVEESFLLIRYFKFFNLKYFGEFICKQKNEQYLKEFTQVFDFCDMAVVDALRLYFSSFYLICESQIIHRVLEFFADKYFRDNLGRSTFMDISDDNKTKEFIFMFSYSLIALNTKIHNPNIKQKPTFQDYISDFSDDEIPQSFTKSYLEAQYESIKAEKIDLASHNVSGKNDYIVLKRIMARYNIQEKISSNFFICPTCVVFAYKNLFKSSVSLFLRTDPDTFYEICELIEDISLVEMYLDNNKDDTYKYLRMFKNYLKWDGKEKFYTTFIHVLKRIEKPKVSVFSEIKNTILKVGSSHSDIKESILPQYKSVYSDISSADIKNVNMIISALKATTNVFVVSLVLGILVNNVEQLDDVSMLSDEHIVVLMDQCVILGNRPKFCQLSYYLSDYCLLKYYKNLLETSPRFVNHELVNRFKEVSVYNQDGFCSVIYLQKEFDMFDYVVDIVKEDIECRPLNSILEDKEYFYVIEKDNEMLNDGQDCMKDDIGDDAKVEEQLNDIKAEEQPVEDQLNGVKAEDKPVEEQLNDIKAEEQPVEDQLNGVKAEDKPVEDNCVDEISKIGKLIKELKIDQKSLQDMDEELIKDLLFLKVDNTKEVLSCFSVSEKYKDILDKPTSLFHFYSSSKSILNQSKAKSIHKSGCPFEMDLFKSPDMDNRLIYMIRKCDMMGNKDIMNYTLWIINLLSSSLPLFCKFWCINFGILITIKNMKITTSVVKIFCSRLMKSLSGTPLCCLCNHNSLFYVDLFIKRLIKYDLVVPDDFEFYFSKRMDFFKNGTMFIKDKRVCIKQE